ncbi:copper transpport protein [Fusarium equiseti]|uniref:Copper transport protein n=1 Tax=Fusarium equiseti TaxID=61235 RepID=A0ABQ8RSS9_FUSEQ|nr:copper transpport protein [Fusarium equiseti]
MDHAHMDHSSMDHGGMDHGHGGMKDMCSMNMLFTWDTTNLCIVFRQWHVRSTTSLLFSLLAVILLSMGYEALRSLSRRYEQALDNRVRAAPSLDGPVTESTPILPGQSQGQADQRAHLVKAILYALQNFYAFMLM